MAEWFDLPWTLKGTSTAVQPNPPGEPRPGDLWLDDDEDVGHPVPPSGLIDLAERLTVVESAVAGPRTVDPAPTVTLTPRPGLLVDRVTWQTPTAVLVVPQDGADGQILRLVVQATGGTRTVTLDDAVGATTGLPDREFPVPAGGVLIAALERAFGQWYLTAAAVGG